ncbi:MAG: 30S ribosomal protein S16 [Planctomycetota bacterium]|nr:30S ribosomal protein S16 [Planctomycetota bacterium]
MVKIRLQRTGRRNSAQFRLVLTDARVKRQGRYLERLGHYDPAGKDETKIDLNLERVKYWLEHGAQPTESAAQLLRQRGVNVRTSELAAKEKRRASQKAKPKKSA